MTQDEIIEIARQAGFHVDEKAKQYQPNFIFHAGYSCQKELEAFAKLVAAKERKEWAKEFAGMGEWTAVHILEARGEA